MKPPVVSVVLVSYGTRDLTLAALESVRDRAGGVPLEAIVVDNASPDGSADAVARAHAWAKLVRSPENRGFAAGANRGAREAAGEWLLFLNPDARLTEGALPALLREGRALPRPGAIGPRVVAPNGVPESTTGHFHGPWRDFVQAFRLDRLVPWSRAFEGVRLRRLPRATARVDWVSGACLLVRRDAFEEAGGFDEAYFLYVEDMDLCHRFARSGRTNLHVPAAVVEHHLGRSPREGSGILLEGGNAPEYFVRKAGIAYPWLLQRTLRIITLAGWLVALESRVLAAGLRGTRAPETRAAARLGARSLAALLGFGPGPRYLYRRRRWQLLFSLVDGVGSLVHRPHRGPAPLGAARSILVLKLDQTGDLILTLPLLEALRRAAPRARIEVAVGEGRSGVLAGVPGIDAVHELPVRLRAGEGRNRIRRKELGAALRGLRASRPDVTIAAKEEPLTVLLAWRIGSPVRVGFAEGGLGFLLTHAVPLAPEGRHQWRILASLAGPEGERAAPPLHDLHPAARAEARTEAAGLEAALRDGLPLPLVVVHPGAGIAARRWPAERFAAAARAIAATSPSFFLWVSGPEDGPLPETLLNGMPPPSRSAAVPGPLRLPVLAALLERAALVLANESAPAHLASAVGTPAVVPFLSSNDPGRWGPCGPGSRVVIGAGGGVPGVEEVAGAAIEVIRERSDPAADFRKGGGAPRDARRVESEAR